MGDGSPGVGRNESGRGNEGVYQSVVYVRGEKGTYTKNVPKVEMTGLDNRLDIEVGWGEGE